MNRLKEKYLNEVVPALMSKFNYKSIMQVPKIEKTRHQHGCRRCGAKPESIRQRR